ncbi:MAG: GNAT family N-acetyltransferase [Actinobacteria bacterium]|nr:GNAT family N-acetyltransferase [Actinomycetota bacterium]
MSVRQAVATDDLAAAGDVVRTAYFALPGYPHDPEYDDMIADVSARVHESIVVIALLDDRLVGCLTYVPDHHDPHAEFQDEEGASFRYFGVLPDVQGRGVGQAMVDWCVQRARADGRRRLRIHTLESMPAAQRMYLRMGFERDPGNDEEWDGIKGIAFVLHL